MEEKGKVNVAVIHRDDALGPAIASTVKQFKLTKLTGTFKHADQYADYRRGDKLNEPEQLVIVGERDALQTGDIIKRYDKANMIVIKDHPPNTYIELLAQNELQEKIANHSTFRKFARGYSIEDHALSGNLPRRDSAFGRAFLINTFQELASRGQIRRALDIAIFGMGKLGNGIADRLIKHDWVKNVYVASNYLRDETGLETLPCKRMTGEVRGGSKVKPLLHVEDLVETNADIFLVCTGPDKAQYATTREEFTEVNFLPSLMKLKPFMEAYAKRKNRSPGIVAIKTHPPGPFQDIFHRKYEILPESQTSFPIDMYRAQEIAYLRLCEKVPALQGLEREHMPLNGLWGHGEDVAIQFENDRILPYLGVDVFSWLSHADRELITLDTRDEGRKVMEISKKSGMTYPGVPEVVVDCCNQIAHYEPKPPFAWYAHVPHERLISVFGRKNVPSTKGNYLMVPVTLSAVPLGVSYSIDYDLEHLSPDLIEKLRATLEKQERRAKLGLETLADK